jgi:hypothetical protein
MEEEGFVGGREFLVRVPKALRSPDECFAIDGTTSGKIYERAPEATAIKTSC